MLVYLLCDKMREPSFLVILLLHIGLYGFARSEGLIIPVLQTKSVTLDCPITIDTCGSLHSVKWFKGNERIAVVSGDGNFVNTEGGYKDRIDIDHRPNGPTTSLKFKSVQVADEDVYICEKTFDEPVETCSSLAPYNIELKILVPPSSIVILDEEGNKVQNGTTLGPLREGHTLGGICEVKDTRPKPDVAWFRAGKRLTGITDFTETDGLFEVQSKLSLILTRQELGSLIECRVESPALDVLTSNHIFLDLQVRPTSIQLSGITSHTVQGTKNMLQCIVAGARPAVDITWKNNTLVLNPKFKDIYEIDTKSRVENDGTFETISVFKFTSTRFENGKEFKCEADNIVMRDDLDKPIHKSKVLDVFYPPVVTVGPESIQVNESMEVLLSCNYQANPQTLNSVKWYRNGQMLKPDNLHYTEGTPEQPSITIVSATRDDIGNYTCELENAVGSAMSGNQVELDVQYVPTVYLDISPAPPIIENEEQNVTLICNVQRGNPPELLSVQWFLDEMKLTETPNCANDSEDDRVLCGLQSAAIPNQLLLTNVSRQFWGNYSCRGFNLAGWGERSEESELMVFYEPGPAVLSHEPMVPLKKKSLKLSCSVEDEGNPKATKFIWTRGGSTIMDVVMPTWTVDPVGLDTRTNFSCHAQNKGGNGTAAIISLNVFAAPSFITSLHPYTGALYSIPDVSLQCRVECNPICSISWFKNGVGIDDANDDMYYIKTEQLGPDHSTFDFESVKSTLFFNMTAWPGGKFDIDKDNANYSCVSSLNEAGSGVRSYTYLAIEYSPENTTIKGNSEVVVEEGAMPPKLFCSARSNPAPKFDWKYDDHIEATGTNVLQLNKALMRTDAGNYSCIAYNKHGKLATEVFINVTYKPHCSIIRREIDDDDMLICTAVGNPPVYNFTWSLKSENDTADLTNVINSDDTSFLKMDDDYSVMRVYRCKAENSVGQSEYCEIEVEGLLPWYQRWEMTTLMILLIGVPLLLLAVIIICIIIICICRRRRRQEKFVTYKKTPVMIRPVVITGSESQTLSKGDVEATRKRKKGNPDKFSAAGDPLTDPGEYENLPFHGLQSAPTKLNFNTNTTNSNVVRVAPRPKNPSTYQLNNNSIINHNNTTMPSSSSTSSATPSSNNFYSGANTNFSHFVSYPNYMNNNKILMGNGIPLNGPVSVGGGCGGGTAGGFISNESSKKVLNGGGGGSTSYNPFLIKKNGTNCDSDVHHHPSEQVHPHHSAAYHHQQQQQNATPPSSVSDKKYNSLKSHGVKKSPQFYSMRVNKCRRHHHHNQGEASGGKTKQLPFIADEKDLLEQPVYENLTDSIQIHESSYSGYGEPERMSIYRSDSGISNSSYECITPVPAPRTTPRNCQSAPVYMNVPNGSHSKNGYYHRGRHNSKCKQNGATLTNAVGAFVNFERSSKNPFIQEEQDQQQQPQPPQQQYQLQQQQQQQQQQQPFHNQQHRDRKQQILIPKELFPSNTSSSSATNTHHTSSSSSSQSSSTNHHRRPIKLPLRKHHSFHFQPSQTTAVAAVKQKKSYKNNGPLLFKPFSERSAFKPIVPVPKSPNKSAATVPPEFYTPPRVTGTNLKRHMSNVETSHNQQRLRHQPNLTESDNDNENSLTSTASSATVAVTQPNNRDRSNNCDSSSVQGSSNNSKLAVINPKRIVYADLAPLNSPSSADDKSSDEQIKLKNLNDSAVSTKRTITQYATLKFNEVNI